jgi:hypothetical protein
MSSPIPIPGMAVIGDDDEVALTLSPDLIDVALGRANGHEPAYQKAHTIFDLRYRFFHGNGRTYMAPLSLQRSPQQSPRQCLK